MRCFIAVGISDAVREALAGIAGRLKPLIAGARWVPPESMHMTLRFLGEIDDETAGKVRDALAAVPGAPFQARFSGLGAFPSEERAAVLWAGVAGGSGELVSLAARVTEVTKGFGVKSDEKPFIPHLTLARIRPPAGLERLEVFRELKETGIGMSEVGGFLLMRSILRPGGPVYETIGEYGLGGGRA